MTATHLNSLSINQSVCVCVCPSVQYIRQLLCANQAEACRSVGKAMQKCPHGMYAEIKYDGERVQVHKQGDKFDYFSRSLKAVQPHKVSETLTKYVLMSS